VFLDMAPVPAHVDPWSVVLKIHTRGKRCDSWNCLSSSEQAGIIISIVVTSMILLFFYMYYLGKVTIAHQEVVIRRQRQRQRRGRRSNQTQLRAVPLVQLPVVPDYPSENVVYTYSPFIYHPAGQVTNLQSQTTRILVPQQPIPAVTPFYPTTFVGLPVVSQVNNVRQQSNAPEPSQRPASVLTSTPSERSSRHQPEWWQHLRRVFWLPIGRASTIATESIPGTPTIPQSGPDDAQREGRLNRSGPGHTPPSLSPRLGQECAHNVGYLGPIARDQDDGRRGTTRVQSPASAVATVHSDDFDIV
jgi:hypothetical protein